jgi:hypothetical protein
VGPGPTTPESSPEQAVNVAAKDTPKAAIAVKDLCNFISCLPPSNQQKKNTRAPEERGAVHSLGQAPLVQ